MNLSQNKTFKTVKKSFSNLPGWRTKRKLIIFESDDWGSIRMPTLEVYKKLQQSGINFETDGGYLFNKYDSLASSEDLSSLFEVLASFKDANKNPAVFTPIAIVANPDFERIKQAEFREYFYEPFNETLKRFQGKEDAYKLWLQGISNGIFVPQFHGREHLNVRVWMKALQAKHPTSTIAFNNSFWGISTQHDPDIKVEFQAAFDFINPEDLDYQQKIIITGLDLFEKLFTYRARCFVPPNGPFNTSLEKTCFKKGIEFITSPKIHYEPTGNHRTRRKLHWIGQKAKSGITYITRNCFFEPVQRNITDWPDICLAEISNAFKYKKPAVISSHRLNYIGSLHQHNRDHGLNELKKLLKGIVTNWPDAEFITSDKLGELIVNE